jgi:hypothetical protein
MSVSSNNEDTVMKKRFILFSNSPLQFAAVLVGCGKKQTVTTTTAAAPPIPTVTTARVRRSSLSENL